MKLCSVQLLKQCTITQSEDLVFGISWVSQGLDSVTMCQPWLIILPWPWLFQISQKPHPVIINIVKVLHCHQTSFWFVKKAQAALLTNGSIRVSTEHGCHFYDKFDSLTYCISLNHSWGQLFLFSHQKGTIILGKAIIRGRQLFQIFLTESRAVNILFYYPIK